MRKNKIINFIIITAILVILIWLIIDEYKTNQIPENPTKNISNNQNTQNNKTKTEKKEQKTYPKEKVVTKYKGYDVIANLKISKIKLETNILKNFSEEAMKVCVTKLEGPNPNTNGNFCVVGHNFKNMFKNLKELKKGDTFTISDNKVGAVPYEIYDIYTVIPTDTSCLSQKTNKIKEVTLITCTTDSKKRIIVKAKEMEKK